MSKDEDWCVDENNELHLKNGHCSQLPNSPNCPTLVKLFLELPRLTMIPPSFFDCMPVLEVLDLSNTNIMSLPPSISKLRLLQELFLRDCSALMELPPQIGELKKLKLFDLEGSEIMYLPKEIGNLKDLECLRVSLSTYADDYIKTKAVDKTIIPRMMISKLTKLMELSIDVNPEAEWWENEVETIQHELCELGDLETLRWYIPTAKILQKFLHLERNGVAIYAGLSNFKLTIGQHAQLTSCLPRDLEKKFEIFNKCLKCANDEGSMTDISKIIRSARALVLHRHWTIEKLSVFNPSKLKHCLLVECSEMQTLVEADDDVSGDGETGEKAVLGSLEYLGIHNMKKLQSIWRGPIGKNSLSCLRVLALHTCPKLTTIFTQNVAENLLNLTELIVEDCSKVESIISIEFPRFIFVPFFPNLKKIVLLDLPELVSICRGQPMSPELDSMLIYNCLKLRYLSSIELLHVKEIKGESEWWNAQFCVKSRWSGIFIELKKERDLVEELAEATNSLQHFHDIMKISYWPDVKHQTAGNSSNYGTSRQSEAANETPQGTYSSYHTSSMPPAYYASSREKLFPERPDQPECQYYMKTGDCKFGSVCRFHHPKERMTPMPNTLMSPLGLPLRPGLPLCSYYSQYGVCKYGPSCKFDHPMGGLTLTNNFQPSNLPFRPSLWPYSRHGSHYSLPREKVFPERPDQPECQYYMKTGDCKFGATCKFHHPKETKVPAATSLLSPLGLPLRPGEPLCIFYSRTGMCKFGPNCKFDHPMVSSGMGVRSAYAGWFGQAQPLANSWVREKTNARFGQAQPLANFWVREKTNARQ